MVRSRRFCLLVGILIIGLHFEIAGRLPDARAAAKPNIVMIVADDAGYNDVHFDSSLLTSAATTAETPNLDALAAQSMVMRQGYSASPLSTAARAGLLSGVAPSRYGVEGDLPNDINNTFGLPHNQTLLPAYLKGLSYQTMAIGKWHEGYVSGGPNGNRPLDMGFDGFYGYLSGSRSYGKDTTPSNLLLDGNTSVENTWQTPAPYLTDALGNKAVQYIGQHAGGEQPFFLYTALPAPHSPYQYIQADYDHFSNITNTAQRAIAAQMLDMDRQIGNIQNALKDPNHDGNTSDSIYDNTIIVFVSDIGGGNLAYLPNTPYRGYQGQTWDGGIRVPYLIKAPGLQAGIYNSPVSTYDLLPTLYSAAGGDASQLTTDGTNILPYLSNAQAGNPHAELVWRSRGAWAIRKGDLKLEHPDGSQANTNAVFDMAAHPTEPVGFNILGAGDQPTKAKIAELYRDFTTWEAAQAKPVYGPQGLNDRNRFDGFVFRNNLASTTNWSTAGAWTEAENRAHTVTMNVDDAYANDVVQFLTRDDASYTSNNDMTRMSGLTYMLNQVRLFGSFAGGSAQSGTINGNPLLFVKSLTGQTARIQLDATAGGGQVFTFNLNNELQLNNDLEISGDGTQNFVIGGVIRDFYDSHDPTNVAPHNVSKTGASSVTLTANNIFKGTLAITGGQLHVNGAAAAISAASRIVIGNAGMLVLDSGSITVPTIDNGLPGDYNHDHQVNASDYTLWRDGFGQSGAGLVADGNGDGTVNQEDYDLWKAGFGATSGGALVLNGGNLKVSKITGNVTNSGGTLASGATPAARTIGGTLAENAGILQLLIGGITPGTTFDQLQVGGNAMLGGTLSVQLVNSFVPALNQTFQLLTSIGGVSGAFANVNLPALSAGKAWQLLYGPHSVSLTVVAPSAVILNGDYNRSGVVDAADYTLWRDTLGSTTNLAADGNNDGLIDAGDFDIWKANFGTKAAGGPGASAAAPEPTSFALALVAAPPMLLWRRRFCR